MTNRSGPVIASVVAIIVALLAGAAVAFILLPGAQPTPSSGASLALGSAAASGSASVSASPSAVASSSARASATVGPSATPARQTPTPVPTPKPAPVAVLTFTQLKLDPSAPPGAGVARFVSFRSDGRGTVKVKLKTLGGPGTTHMCLRAGSHVIRCVDASNTTISAETASTHVDWRVDLKGTNTSTPIVDLTVSFPAFAPSVTITHARFDGTASPETNGIQVRFVPRQLGLARLVASWGGHPFTYEIDAINQSSGSGNKTFANQGPSTNSDTSFQVTAAETWKVVLDNTEGGFGPTDLTASISWP